MKSFKICLMSFLIAFSFDSCNSGDTKTASGNTASADITINLKEMKHIGTVDFIQSNSDFSILSILERVSQLNLFRKIALLAARSF